ncbi:hypothetical protein AWC38_SpisGene6906 [Stylophora pistillata]|uniref:SCAN box domain-containing protein n=1 Tax=Stylophora pistillata TaxID=50429 RepID=A0A2B4SCK7_STYPI|nr:hypothetical protein AWC38_SpisGene6906 [Stylophora pistillata]
MERKERLEREERQERPEREERQERLEKEKPAYQHEMEMKKEIYTQLSVEQAGSYDIVEDLILKGYELVPEAYRQKFKNYEKVSSQTYIEFSRSEEQLFDRWCHSQKVDKSHDKLRQLILVEEFKKCIHSDVRRLTNEQRVKTLEDAARLADEFSLSHKVNFMEKPRLLNSRPASFRITMKPEE